MTPHNTLIRRRSGFTLIELLTVIAIIGILAGILIPVVGGAKKSARKAQVRAQFSGYATALSQYKAEYGYFPQIGNLNDSGGPIDLDSDAEDFIKALSARDLSGDRLGDADRKKLNRKNIPFYSFGEAEFSEDENKLLVDSFDNPHIMIMVDHDGDGKIPTSEFPSSSKGSLGTDLRAQVAIWVDEDADGVEDAETIYSWQ